MLKFAVFYEHYSSFFCCRHLCFSGLQKTGLAGLKQCSKMSPGQELRCPLTFHVALYLCKWGLYLFHCLLTSQAWPSSVCAKCSYLWNTGTPFTRPSPCLSPSLVSFLYQQHEGSEAGPARSRKCGSSKLEKLQLSDHVCQILDSDMVCASQSREIRDECSHSSFFQTGVPQSGLEVQLCPFLSTLWLEMHL